MTEPLNDLSSELARRANKRANDDGGNEKHDSKTGQFASGGGGGEKKKTSEEIIKEKRSEKGHHDLGGGISMSHLHHDTERGYGTKKSAERKGAVMHEIYKEGQGAIGAYKTERAARRNADKEKS